ncbi:hypothetical protein M4R22_15070 [Acidovorax sp. GBBC 3334]|uniref:hypothetical protein n=1 Tax=unclassified Acidovorax TaxID=2684926 RepID=UPI002304BB27|nr:MULTISPECIES: hypothetical protein [unclassified Acidovorax]MDA8456089.1 hypothetical protein [Acidovorax sp. GBBC 3334]MDA8521152.1 hypothetical protein [Acidovorax sp. NCPPB 4044]
MKPTLARTLAAAAAFSALLASAPARAAGEHAHGHAHQPLHGGTVAEVKDMDYELVAKADVLQLYLRDHGKPVDVAQASAKVTLLAGADKQDVALAPAGDRLEARGAFKLAPGTKALVQVSRGGKVATVRFDLR